MSTCQKVNIAVAPQKILKEAIASAAKIFVKALFKNSEETVRIKTAMILVFAKPPKPNLLQNEKKCV